LESILGLLKSLKIQAFATIKKIFGLEKRRKEEKHYSCPLFHEPVANKEVISG
jgi:hypothetical protein